MFFWPESQNSPIVTRARQSYSYIQLRRFIEEWFLDNAIHSKVERLTQALETTQECEDLLKEIVITRKTIHIQDENIRFAFSQRIDDLITKIQDQLAQLSI